MKLLKGVSKSYKNIAKEALVLGNEKGGLYSQSGQTLLLKNYSFNDLIGTVEYKEENLFIYKNIKSDDSWLQRSNGDKVNVNKYLLESFISKRNSGERIDNVLYDYFSEYSDIGENLLLRYDFTNDLLKTSPFEYTIAYQVDKDCFATATGSELCQFIKIDANLNDEWLFEAHGRSPTTVLHQYPLDNSDSIIINLLVQQQRTKRFDGEVFCLAKTDGTVIWQRKFPLQVEDCKLLDDKRLAMYTGNELHILDAKSGDTLQTIVTDFEVATIAVYLFVYQNLLFIFNKKQAALHIYQTDDFACIRKLDVAEHGWVFEREPVVMQGKIYMEVILPRMFNGLLVIDPDNIQAPLEIEAEPDFTITAPSEENGQVSIKAEQISIDDLIRFGETLILEQMRDNGASFWNPSPNKLFNGQVLLECNNLLTESELAKPLLDVLVERVNFFAKRDGFRNGKGKGLCTLSYTLE